MNQMPPYLTDPEILEIAKPLTQEAAIVRWFRKNGFPNCRVRPNGLPLIWRSECEPAPVGCGAEKEGARPGGQPNVQALLDRFRKAPKTGRSGEKV